MRGKTLSAVLCLAGLFGTALPARAANPPKVEIKKPPTSGLEGSTLEFHIERGGDRKDPSTVAFSTTNGSATGSDYTDSDQTVTFAAGEKDKTVSVPLTADNSLEGPETFTVAITPLTNSQLHKTTSVVVTILDEDALEVSVADAAPVVEGGNAVFTVTSSGPAISPITVDWATSPGTAAQPADLNAQTGTVTILTGSSSGQFSVATKDDSLDEFSETFTVTLSNPSAGTALHATAFDATGTITDDDDAPTVLVSNNPTVAEGGTLGYEVSLSGPSEKTITVDIETDEGFSQAQPPGDYTATGETLTFVPGETTKTFDVDTNDDALDESDSLLGPGELLWAHITGATNATLPTDFTTNLGLNDRWGAGFIGDNDLPPTVTMSNNPFVAEGGDLIYNVTLDAPSAKTITVNVKTDEGVSQAQAPGDHTAKTDTLTFNPGDTVEQFVVDTNNDSTFDLTNGLGSGELLWAHITGATNATLPTDFTTNLALNDRWSIGFIGDDEVMPTLTMSDNPSAAEGTPLDFTIVLTHPTDQIVTGTIKTEDGFSGATPPGDYTSTITGYTIPAGATSTTFAVTTNDDGLVEPATVLGPGEHVWAHVLTVNNATPAVDFTGNTNTNDLWALGFILDND